jgi:hypothetical protein
MTEKQRGNSIWMTAAIHKNLKSSPSSLKYWQNLSPNSQGCFNIKLEPLHSVSFLLSKGSHMLKSNSLFILW